MQVPIAKYGFSFSRRKAAHHLRNSVENLTWIVIEGGGTVCEA